jgi:hypothetical protein
VKHVDRVKPNARLDAGRRECLFESGFVARSTLTVKIGLWSFRRYLAINYNSQLSNVVSFCRNIALFVECAVAGTMKAHCSLPLFGTLRNNQINQILAAYLIDWRKYGARPIFDWFDWSFEAVYLIDCQIFGVLKVLAPILVLIFRYRPYDA